MEQVENCEVDEPDVLDHPTAGSISAIDKKSVHRICSGQVVLTLATAVKELLENSIDAGSTIIDIKLKDYGAEQIEVSDNGMGVHQKNFEGLTLKHHTSKLQDFSDLINVETFGFRGEALSSLCALSDMSIATRHKDAAVGTKLEYDHNGKILKQSKQARQVGTSVILQNLFYTLPVRHKEFQRNLKKEFVKMVQVLNSYCIISTGVRITCTNQTGKGSRSTVVSSKGNANMLENISNVFGPKQTQSVVEFKKIEPSEDTCCEFGIKINNSSLFSIEGYVSKCEHGQGRSSTDRQFFFINGRPFDSNKLSKVVNEVYHQYNRHQYPFVVFKITVQKDNVDVNVTPDKRQVFLEGEKIILATVKASLIAMFEPTTSMVQYQLPPAKACGKGALPVRDSDLNRLSKHPSLEKPTSLTSLMKLKRSFSSAFSKEDSTNDGSSKSPSKSGPGMKQRRLDSFVSSYHSPRRVSDESTGVSFERKEDNNEVIILEHHKQDIKETSISNELTVIDHVIMKERGESNSEHISKYKEDVDERNENRSLHGSVQGDRRYNHSELPDETGDHLQKLKVEGVQKQENEYSILTEIQGIENYCVQNSSECLQNIASCVQNDTSCVQNTTDVEYDTPCVQNTTDVQYDTPCVQNYESSVQKDTASFQKDRETCNSNTNLKSFVSEYNTDLANSELKKEKPELDLSVNTFIVKEHKMDSHVGQKIIHHEVESKDEASSIDISIIPHETGESEQGGFEDQHLDAEENVERKEKCVGFSMDQFRNRWKCREKSNGSDQFSRAFRATINPAENQAAEQELQREIKKDMFAQMEILGQFNMGFIITKLENDLFIVDQHATDEKYNFETLQRDTVIQSQKLICPMNLELTSSNEIILMDNIEIFRKNGFEFVIDEEGPPTHRVKLVSTPVSKNWNFGKEDIEEMIFMLTDSPGIMCRPSRVRAMFASRACRKSIMIGTTLNKAEMKKLVGHMGEIEQPWNCPHGRPTMRHLINLDMVPK